MVEFTAVKMFLSREHEFVVEQVNLFLNYVPCSECPLKVGVESVVAVLSNANCNTAASPPCWSVNTKSMVTWECLIVLNE